MISREKLRAAVGRVKLLRFFPTDPQALEGLAEILASLCRNDAELQQLVAAALEQWNEWPGPAALGHLYREHVRPEPLYRPEWEDERGNLKPEFADHRAFTEDEVREVAERLRLPQ